MVSFSSPENIKALKVRLKEIDEDLKTSRLKSWRFMGRWRNDC